MQVVYHNRSTTPAIYKHNRDDGDGENNDQGGGSHMPSIADRRYNVLRSATSSGKCEPVTCPLFFNGKITACGNAR